MAQINELQIGLDVLVGAVSGLLGAMGAYFKLKSRLDLQEAKNAAQEKEIDDLHERKKEMNVSLHKRIDDQNSVIQDIQKEMASGHQKLETNMAHMELRIVKEIQKMVEKIMAK
jgi:formiminotetrahydrofolate cyclodeaminase